jgi:hypothetical protein
MGHVIRARSLLVASILTAAVVAPALSEDKDLTGPLVPMPRSRSAKINYEERVTKIIDAFGFEKVGTVPGAKHLAVQAIEDARKSPAGKPLLVYFHEAGSEFARGFTTMINSKAAQKHAKEDFRVLLVEIKADSVFEKTYGGQGPRAVIFTSKGAVAEVIDRPNMNAQGFIDLLGGVAAASKRAEKKSK